MGDKPLVDHISYNIFTMSSASVPLNLFILTILMSAKDVVLCIRNFHYVHVKVQI